jgi:hypothetical protein
MRDWCLHKGVLCLPCFRTASSCNCLKPSSPPRETTIQQIRARLYPGVHLSHPLHFFFWSSLSCPSCLANSVSAACPRPCALCELCARARDACLLRAPTRPSPKPIRPVFSARPQGTASPRSHAEMPLADPRQTARTALHTASMRARADKNLCRYHCQGARNG